MHPRREIRYVLLPLLLALAGLVFAQTGALRDGSGDPVPLRRILPLRIDLLTEAGAPRGPAADPWRLFDGDTDRGFRWRDGGPVRVRLFLDGPRTIAAVGAFGPGGGRLTVLAEQDGEPVLLQDLDLGSLAAGWNRFDVPQPVATRALLLDWQPSSPGAVLPEIELWSAEPGEEAPEEPPAAPGGGQRIAEGSPRALRVAAGQAGAFRVRLPVDPGSLSRAFLTYELAGLSHWPAAVRSINGHPAQGFGAEPASGPSLQIEEINPRWLRRGVNEIRFFPALAEPLPDETVSLRRRIRRLSQAEVVPYEVRNLRLVLQEEDGRLLLPDARMKGWDGGEPVELRFARPSQPYALEVALPEGVRGSLAADALLAGGAVLPLLEPVDLGALGPGRHRLAVREGLPAAVGVRLVWTAPAGRGGRLAGLGVLASPVGRRQGPRLELTHPPASDPAEGGAYLRGFAEPVAGGAPGLLVNGVPVPDGVAPEDGALGVLVPRPDGVEGPWEVRLDLTWPDGSRLSRTLRLGQGSPDAGDGEDGGEGGVEREVSPSEAKSLALRGARLEVPAGAVDRSVKLTMRALATGDLPALDAGMTNVTPGRGGFRMGPHGQRFKKPLRLTLPYDPALIPEGLTTDDVRSFYFDEGAGRWIVLPREEVGGASVVSLTDHFTDFINATLTLPDEPSGADFSPNSIQELAKADPAAGITQIEPPVGGPTGGAGLSFPLELPPGRRGLEPELALQYSSGGGNGWLGLGWDLPIPQIEVSTLFGVPRYDPARETETYLLDGEQLAPVADAASPAPRQADRVFIRRVEGSFERIVRHGSGPADHWWEVTDKAGVRYLYGPTPQTRLQSGPAGNIFRWLLARVVDLHGNTVDYGYAADGPDPGSAGEPWVQLYPARIDYTGANGAGAFYQVRFVLDDGGRPDPSSTGRPGFKAVTRRRLDRIDVTAGGELVRRFLFEYREGAFRKSLLAAVRVTGEDGATELHRHAFDYQGATAAFGAQDAWSGIGGAEDLSDELRGGGGAHAFAGLGPPGCQPHVGLQVGGSVTDTTQQVMFLDVNGDGLPDRIDQDGDVELNRQGSFSAADFDGTDELGHTLEWSFDLALGAHAEFGVTASVSASWVWSHANDDHAVADVNGDGLPDLVSTSGGFAARINDGTSFREQSTWTGFGAGGLDLSVPGEEDEVLSSFKLSDPLRKLELPYTGPITLDGEIQKKQAGGDGVEVEIFHNGTRIWRRGFGANDTAPCVPAPGGACGGGLGLSVRAGDRLYFLAGSVRDTSADALLWAPRVTYTGNDPEAREPYGARVFQFDGREDFRLGGYGGSGWVAPAAGTVRIQGPLVKQTTSDDLRLTVWQDDLDEDNPPVLVYERTFAAAEERSFDAIPPIEVATGDSLRLQVTSVTPVDPARIEWSPEVRMADGKSEPAEVAFQIPRLLPLDPLERPTRSWTAPSAGTHTFDVSGGPFSGGVLYVQGVHRLIERRDLGSNGTGFTVTAELAAGEPIFFTVLDGSGGLEVDGGEVPVNYRRRAAEDEHEVLSGGFHGWFYGEWNGGLPFAESGLVPPEDEHDEAPDYVPGVPRPQGTDAIAAPAWKAAGFDLYLAAEGVKPSRQGGNAAGNLDESAGVSSGSGLGVLRKTYGRTSALSAELIAGIAVSGGSSETQLDLLDMNGDQYPDQVSAGGVRFSNGRSGFGGLEGFAGLDDAVRRAEDGNVTLSLGGIGINFTKKGGDGKPKAVLSTLPSVGSTVSLSQTRYDLVDVNGDGLPDRVQMGSGDTQVSVQLNLGYRFGLPEPWPLPAWSGSGRPGSCQDVVDYATTEVAELVSDVDSPDALSFTRSSALNAGLAVGPFGGGVATTLARTLVELADVNGDGLPDHVAKEQGEDFFRVKLNRGDGWEPEQRWPVPGWTTSIGDGYNPGLFTCVDAVSFSGHVETNVSAGAPICIPLVPPVVVAGLQIELSAQGFVSAGGLQLSFQDLDGDGLADHVLKKGGDSNVYVKRNLADGANLLTAVHRPLGSTIALGYRRQGNRVDHSDPDHRIDMPASQWVLAATSIDDGLGNPPYTTTYDYFDDAYYDRGERESYGYARVLAKRPDGSTVDRRFHNQDFYRRHLLEREEIADASGRVFRVATAEHAPRALGPGAVFPALVRQETLFYEGTGAARKSTAQTFEYDAFGNVIAFRDTGDEGGDDDISAAVAYQVDPQAYVVQPSRIEVRDGTGRLLRRREGTYDARGDLVRLEQTLIGGRDPGTGAPYTGSRNAVWTYAYDGFGNLASSVDPTGFTSTFTYDPAVRTWPVQVSDSFGYVSRYAWNLKHGQVTETVDKNGNSLRRAYDGFGRLVRVVGPYDSDASPTLAFEYDPAARPAWAVVHHKDVARPADPIDSSLFVDGLGRVLQTKEDAELDLGSGTSTRTGMRVSGRVEFDAKGRVAAQGQPVFGDDPPSRFVDVPEKNPTRFAYDVLDRVLEVRFPQGAVTRLAYGFGTLDGIDRFLQTRTDPNGRPTLFYSDVHGDVLGVQQTNTIGGARRTLVTRYAYDALSQLTAVTDPEGNATRLEHDTLGRNVLLDNPDLGRAEFRYDPAGNLGAKINANLAAQGRQVRYLYTFHRLDRIDYPEAPDVLFTYGGPGAPENRAGRIAAVGNESGFEERFYGRLGEVVRTVRTAAALNGSSPKGPYTTAFRFDSFGRLLAVVYPDGEELTYGYDAGGKVKSAAGVLAGVRFDYLRHLGYDEFGQRARQVQGNGVETRWAYDPQSRDLAQLQTLEAAGREIQDLRYRRDLTGTILAIQNDVPMPAPPLYGGPVAQTFRYDDLYQLVAAEGSYRSPPNKQTTYALNLTYDEIDNTVAKNQLHQVGTAGKLRPEKKTSYSWAYAYGGPRPHAPTRIGDRTFRYDANGNQTGWETDRNGTRRTLTWDEENRLKVVADNGQTTRFLYDASGVRTNKAGQHGETIYVNRWFSLRNGAIASKHVFADGVRLATKVSPDPNPPAEKVYWYQADHLGSTHFVTDERGTAWQHLEYFPSGEVWVDERSETQRTPYSFSGKELDEETGLSYFGFRYYDARQGQWISADPILDGMLDPRKIAGTDPSARPFHLPGHLYAYVANSPTNLIDPVGLMPKRARGGSSSSSSSSSNKRRKSSQRLVISGHGQFNENRLETAPSARGSRSRKKAPTFEVPADVTITFYAPHGAALENQVANRVEQGKGVSASDVVLTNPSGKKSRVPAPYPVVNAGGEQAINYTVSPPTGLSVVAGPSVRTVAAPTTLKTLVDGFVTANPGQRLDIHFACCTAAHGPSPQFQSLFPARGSDVSLGSPP